jgi:hypothetical protein
MLKCSDCAVEFAGSFCPKCGGAAEAVGQATKLYRVCLQCGGGIKDHDNFCGSCGLKTDGGVITSTSAIDAAVQGLTVMAHNQKTFDERARLILVVLFVATGLLGFVFPPLWTLTPIFAIAGNVYISRVKDAKNKPKEPQ